MISGESSSHSAGTVGRAFDAIADGKYERTRGRLPAPPALAAFGIINGT